MPQRSRSLDTRLRRLRKSIGLLTEGPQRRYPPVLRDQIAAYAQDRLQDGVARAQVCKELGVSDPTVERLLRENTPRLHRVRVRSVTVAPDVSGGAIVVRGPGGVVVEGLDVAGVADLIRALS